MKKVAVILMVFVVFNIFVVGQIQADAWWGKGYKTPEWVIDHGGTLIYFRVLNAKKKPLIKLFTAKGNALERETGTSGVFDDALANTAYYLRAQGDGKFKSVVFTLQRGSINYAIIDYKEEKITMVLGKNQKKVISQRGRSEKVNLEKLKTVERPYQMSFVLEDKFIKYPLISRPKLPVYWEDDFLTLFWFPREY